MNVADDSCDSLASSAIAHAGTAGPVANETWAASETWAANRARAANGIWLACWMVCVLVAPSFADDTPPSPTPKATPTPAPPGTTRIRQIDGSVSIGKLTDVTADGSLIGESLPPKLRWDDVWRLERVEATSAPPRSAAAPAEAARRIVVETRNAARLQAADVSLADDQVTLSWPLSTAPVTFSIDDLHALWFDRPETVIAQAPSLAKPSAEVDRVVVIARDDREPRDGGIRQKEGGARVQILPGLVTGCAPQTVTMERDGRSYAVARSTVLAVVMAAPPGDVRSTPAAVLHLTDGSLLPVTAISGTKLHQSDGAWNVESFAERSIRLPGSSVLRMDVLSPRLTLLGTSPPIKVEHQSWIVEPLAWRRDRSVDGRVLQLDGRRYETGLGMQAGTRLTFSLTGSMPTLYATVGLNDRTAKRGDCQVSVLGDSDSPLWTARLRGGDRPLAVRVPLRDNRQVTLVVEPGENLDLGDHVDWCEARLVAERQP